MTEDQMQRAIIEFAQLYLLPVHHSPNAGKRSMYLGKKLKDLGMMPGFSDLFFLQGNDKYKGLFIELKVKPNKPTTAQLKFIELVNSLGYLGTVVYELDDAIKIITTFYNL